MPPATCTAPRARRSPRPRAKRWTPSRRRSPKDTLLLVTADHGQLDVAAERLDLLDELWPELPRHLTHGPAGSARDCFLHVPGSE
jgi:hypothetical protein